MPPLELYGRVGAILRESLPVDLNQLKTHLRALELLRMDVLEHRVDWGQKVAEKSAQMLYPKDKEKTELDRKTMLNASVADLQRDYEFLKGLETLVAERLQLGLALLK